LRRQGGRWGAAGTGRCSSPATHGAVFRIRIRIGSGFNQVSGSSVADSDPEPEGSETFGRIRNRNKCFGSGYGFESGGAPALQPGGYKEKLSICADQWRPRIRVQMRGDGGEGGSCGVSANEYSCAHHVTWSPYKLWRSTSIFNLCLQHSGQVESRLRYIISYIGKEKKKKEAQLKCPHPGFRIRNDFFKMRIRIQYFF
jgi:hypothetical protein